MPSLTSPVILGAGPAGCAAAISLAQGGAAPQLIDRDAEAADALCGGFISWRTALQLRGLGVDPARLGGHQVDCLALQAGSQSAEIALPAPSYGLSRYRLDNALRQRAREVGTRLVVDTARSIQGGTVVGKSQSWTGDGLFLATGKHDLRGLLRPRQSRDPALGLRLRLPPNAERHRLLDGRIELHLFAGGYAGIVLQEDGSANLCLALRKSLLTQAGNMHRLIERLSASNPALAQRLGEDWRHIVPDTIGAVPYGYIECRTDPGLFRLGDQAAVIPSLAGEGMGIALASGTMAATHWLKGGASAAPEYQRAFAASAAGPVRLASIAWHLAESRLLARLGIALASQLPQVIRAIMTATRLDMPAPLARASLAQASAAS